eukprot:7986598-Pyramimonas_sp.AAC.1
MPGVGGLKHSRWFALLRSSDQLASPSGAAGAARRPPFIPMDFYGGRADYYEDSYGFLLGSYGFP